MYRILIIEDDHALCGKIVEGLQKWKFEPVIIEDFEDIMKEFVQNSPHLVLLDINLPYFDGFHWCRKIREISKVPILFLSSRDANMDILMAVNMGGDDFIAKPFSMDILMAKIQALLRRTYSYSGSSNEVIECSRVVLNISESSLLYRDSKIDLTKNELKILMLLMKNKGKVIPREKIMKILWDEEVFVNDNTLTVNINRLRSKLEEMGLENWISTKKGQGYIIL
ncbi:MAG: response regulator transcription factor [Clostridia bacterium]|nr:response regulator transcription factor [Clostridia bacterium]